MEAGEKAANLFRLLGKNHRLLEPHKHGEPILSI